jgi:hypothetical protein
MSWEQFWGKYTPKLITQQRAKEIVKAEEKSRYPWQRASSERVGNATDEEMAWLAKAISKNPSTYVRGGLEGYFYFLANIKQESTESIRGVLRGHLLEASRASGAKAIRSEVQKTLAAAVGRYSSYLGMKLKVAQSWTNFSLKKKGGYDWLKAYLFEEGTGKTVHFTIKISNGTIDAIRGSIQDSSGNVLKVAKDIRRMSSAEPPIEPGMLADPKNVFGHWDTGSFLPGPM